MPGRHIRRPGITCITHMAGRILVVDDDRALNDLVRERLQARGFDCIQAFDGAQARDALDSEAPDALVLELNLPDTTGDFWQSLDCFFCLGVYHVRIDTRFFEN